MRRSLFIWDYPGPPGLSRVRPLILPAAINYRVARQPAGRPKEAEGGLRMQNQ